MFTKKNLIRITANSLLGVILIFVWTRFISFETIGGILKNTNIAVALLFCVAVVLSGVLRSFRLKLLLKNYRFSYRNLLTLTYLSQFLSFLIPLRAGELTKSVYLSTQHNIPFGKTLSWVFIDRFLDFWMIIILISIFMLLTPTSLPPKVISLIFILLVFFTLAFVVAITSEKLFKRIINIVGKMLIFPKIQSGFIKFSHTIIEGFEVLRRSPFELASLTFITLVATIIDSTAWFVAFLALGQNLGVAPTLLGTSLTALSFLVPAAPGYVGSAQAASLAVFSGIIGLEANLVSAASVLYHIMTLVTILAVGIISLYLLDFDLGLVWKKIRGEK